MLSARWMNKHRPHWARLSELVTRLLHGADGPPARVVDLLFHLPVAVIDRSRRPLIAEAQMARGLFAEAIAEAAPVPSSTPVVAPQPTPPDPERHVPHPGLSPGCAPLHSSLVKLRIAPSSQKGVI